MRLTAATLTLSLALVTGCNAQPPTGPVTPAAAPAEAKGWKPATLVSALDRPWGMAWLPGGSILITEKRGTIRLVSADFKLQPKPIADIDAVLDHGQGGLMDIALHPKFAENNLVYVTYTSGTRDANRTTLARATYTGGSFSDFKEIFRVSQDKQGGQHFGSRILFLADGTLLMSIGDGGNPPTRLDGDFIRKQAQSNKSHLGKVLRLNDDGTPAAGNPFKDGNPAVWSIGHRNIQGLAIDAAGNVWANEHGARGGDEINLVRAGSNYGWPTVTYSIEYWGPQISDKAAGEGFVDPVVVWTPCPAPSGLVVYGVGPGSDKIPTAFDAWKGSLFSGGLVGNDVRRVAIDMKDGKPVVAAQESLKIGERVRDVRQGPDGFLYLLTDESEDGKLIRIEPAN